MKSKEILSDNDRRIIKKLSDSKVSSLMKLNLEALEVAEQELEECKELFKTAIQSSLDQHADLIDKYGEISWQIETLANNKDQEQDGISNSLFRQLVRELIDFKIKEILTNHVEEMSDDSQIAINKQYEGMEF